MSPPASAATASESTTTTVFEEDTRQEVLFSVILSVSKCLLLLSDLTAGLESMCMLCRMQHTAGELWGVLLRCSLAWAQGQFNLHESSDRKIQADVIGNHPTGIFTCQAPKQANSYSAEL